MLDRETLKSALSATPECLSQGQLELIASGQTQGPPHLTQCPRCSAEVAMLKSFQSDAPLPDEGAAVAWISSHLERQLENIKDPTSAPVRANDTETRSQMSWWARTFGSGRIRWLVPAGAIVTAVIVGVVLLRPPKEPELRADAGSRASVFRSGEIQVVGPVGDLAQVPTALQWQAFPGVAAYKVVVMEIDRSPLWMSETKETSIGIPVSTRAKMLPGKPILWQVTAVDAQGRALVTSQVQRFVVPREHSGSGDSFPPQ